MLSTRIICRRPLLVTVLLAGMAVAMLSSGVAWAESSSTAKAPRFLVPDFRSSDPDEGTWVALAVSEGLRARLRRSGATTAVSAPRTAGVMNRMSDPNQADPKNIVRIAGLLGTDWVAMGSVTIDGDGMYVLKLDLRHTKLPDRKQSKTVHGGSTQALLDGATTATLAAAGVKLTDAQRKRVAAEPGGSASAVEYHAKAVRAVRMGKPKDALFYVAQSRQYDSDFRPTAALLGQINIAAGNAREVLLIYGSLLRLAKVAGDPVDEVVALAQLAIGHQRIGRLDAADKYYDTAIKKSRAVKLEDMTAVLLGMIATLRIDQKKSDEALKLLEQRLAMLEAQGDRLALGSACLTVGLVCAAKDDIPKALEYLHFAVKIAEEVGIKSDKAVAFFQIGELHKQKKEFDKAIAAYRASMAASDESETGSACRQIAGIHEEQGELDLALEMLRKAESILSARKAYAQQADCLARIARIHAKRKDHARAVSIMETAIEMLSDLGRQNLDAYKKELAGMKAAAKAK